ncbi:MAG: hypothetical protein N2511_08105 [Thermodesulfovibrionales bacterium]|nr:hypothetical protein [Thermodesulfovibrionales bacterium]
MEFEVFIKRYFDSVLKESVYIEKTFKILNDKGFNPRNTIVSVCICRDEISQPLVTLVKERWGETFNLCSLAGLFSAGSTALKAAMHHSPIVDNKERYVFYALPHIAIDAKGEFGVCRRKGRFEDSNACGALNVFLGELKSKKLNTFIDKEDIELSLIKNRLLREIPYGYIPDLLELTKITLKTTREDLQNAFSRIIDVKKSDYALLTGIQIHGPDGNYVSPDISYTVIDGEKKELEITE